jgi:hypothetical protein
MGDDPVAWRYGFPRPRPFCGELPSATLRGRGLDPGIARLELGPRRPTLRESITFTQQADKRPGQLMVSSVP